MKENITIRQKISNILSYIIGGSLMICLFVGALGFVGYIIAFCSGGETAVKICDWIYNVFYSFLIKLSTVTVLVSFVHAYFKGDAKFINPIKYWKNKLYTKKINKLDKQN